MSDYAVCWIIEGRVQGVGFRYFAREIALALEVRGTVRNRRDGTVEVVACAPRGTLAAFRLRLEQGPAPARVARISEKRFDGQMPPRFDVRY